MQIAARKENRIITPYGLTKPYHPRCGLDQGVTDDEDTVIEVSDLAFVDDTTWIADSQDNMQTIVDIALEFFALNSVEVNPKKTELVTINVPTEPAPTIRFGADDQSPITALPIDTAARTLGVWVSSDGSNKYTEHIMHEMTDKIVGLLARKHLTDKQVVFIINSVLLPTIAYRLSIHIPSPTAVDQITKQYTNVVREKNWICTWRTQHCLVPPPPLRVTTPR
ncbi:hypothetical protein BGZ73_007785 [Actinomortierella ambigua]|nr:hypothetical protein BGZ73_007785 [Actinomortierella ambigua]